MSSTDCVRSHPDGALLTVWVVPGARRTEIVGYYGDALRVRVAAPPEKGQANKVLIALIGDAVGARVRLASGAGSRRKRLIAVGITAEELTERIRTAVN